MAKERIGIISATDMKRLKQNFCSKCRELFKGGELVNFVTKNTDKDGHKKTFPYHKECWERVLQ